MLILQYQVLVLKLFPIYMVSLNTVVSIGLSFNCPKSVLSGDPLYQKVFQIQCQFFHIRKWITFAIFNFVMIEEMASVQMGHWSIAKAEMTSQCKSQKVTIYTYIPWYNVYYIDLSGTYT